MASALAPVAVPTLVYRDGRPPMSNPSSLDPHDEPLPGLNIQEAAEVMGVSVSVMRQWCATGRVRTAQVTRGSVHAIRVLLDPPPAQASGPSGVTGTPRPISPPAPAPAPLPPDVPAIATESSTMPALAEALHSAPGLLAPFVAELTAAREAGERRAADLRVQSELIGRLSSELDAARATITDLAANEHRSEQRARQALVALMAAVMVAVVAVAVAVTVWFGR